MSQVDNDHDYQRAAEPQTLTLEQLNYAREIIAKKRPMTDIHITKVWPWFKSCGCCGKRKPSFKLALKKALLNKLDMEIPTSDIALDEDPFLQVGYGINAYFDVISQLAWMFVFISIFMIPSMIKYSEYGGVKDFSPFYALDQFTLGNMGGASVLCQNVPVAFDTIQLTLSCPSGQLDFNALGHQNQTKIFNFGIVNNDDSLEYNDYCQVSQLPQASQQCLNWFDSSKFQADLYSECQGKHGCSIGYLNDYALNNTATPAPTGCFTGAAMLFVQAACTYTDEQLVDRQILGLYNACMGVFISLFMIVYVDYIRSVQANNYIEWDVKTITAGDYSVEFDISDKFWELFQEKRGKTGDSRIDDKVEFEWDENKTAPENFRIWMQNQIELRMSELPDLGYEENPIEHIDVAVTTLAYDNAKLINLLRKRGQFIISESYESMREVDEKINKLKQTEFQRWTQPVSVFITFQYEEGLQRALALQNVIENNPSKYGYLNEWFEGQARIEIQQASEPSDIIWENRHFTDSERNWKAFYVFCAISLMLFGSFITIFAAQKWSYALMGVYPNVSCKQFDVYPDTVLASLAVGEFQVNEQLADQGQKVTYSGYVQCYCQETLTNSTLSTTPDYINQNGEQMTGDEDICTAYFNNVWFVLFMTNCITGFIVVVNTIIKTVAIELITWIGYDTQSQMLTKITNGVFISLFFNTGFLLILSNANWSQYRLPLQNWFDGPFDDYSPDWYVYVANTLTQTMIINCFFQTGFQIAMDSLTWYLRRRDQKWGKTQQEKLSNTMKTQIGQYIALFQGDAYIVHFKFSMVFNAVFVTMLYGMGVPMLFPIAVIGLVVFWMLERYCVAYTYQMPPSLDDNLTKNAIQLLLKAPMFYMANGFWMLTNTQIFQGWVNPISIQGDHMITNHTVPETMSVNQASPLFYIMILLSIIVILESYFAEHLSAWGFSLSQNKIEVDENLPDFYQAIKLSDADWVVHEQQYYDREYDMKIAEPELAKKMDEVSRPVKAVQGIAWYKILANPDYITAFNYIEVNVPDRSNLIVDDDDDEGNDNEQSDTVQLALNLGMLKTDIAMDMPFGKGMMAYMKNIKDKQN